MSPLRPRRLRVLIEKEGVLIVGDDKTYLADDPSGPLENALVLAFGRLLEDSSAKAVEVLLSSAFVDYLIIPGLQHWLADADLIALGRSRLAVFYATDQTQREVRVTREAYGIPSLVYSASKHLLDALRKEAARRQVALTSVCPLAILVVAALKTKWRNAKPTAIWIEEKDALWIGVRSNRCWLSARSLPANVLQHASRSDLLQRECLTAGLPGVEQIYYAASSDIHVAEKWGTTVTDFSKTLTTANACRKHTLDFIARPTNRLGWTLFAAAMSGLGATAYAWVDSQDRYMDALTAQEQHRESEVLASKKRRIAEDAVTADYSHAMSAYRVQVVPWGELFSVLNECGGDAIGVTNFKADAPDRSLTIEGEAKRFEDVQLFVDALSKRAILSGIRITTLVPGGDVASGRIRFALTATWSSGLTLEAPSKP